MHFLIIGVGSIGERHLRNFLRIDDVQCSIAEINPQLRGKIAADYQVQDVYPDYRDAPLPTYDGVVICTPANLHVAMATDVISAGTHVLSEKPLAMSFEGIDELKRLRDEKGVIASVAFPMRSEPLITEIKQRVDAAELGPVLLVNWYAGQYWPRMRKDYPPQYAQNRHSGGGAIPDMIVHTINYLEWIFGPAAEVSANHWSLGLHDIATEDTASVTLRFADGPIAQVGLCLYQRDTNVRQQFIAQGGTLQMTGDSDTVAIFDDQTGQWIAGTARACDRDDLFRAQAQHFIDCIQGKATPRCTIEQGEQTLRTVLAALESADSDSRFIKV